MLDVSPLACTDFTGDTIELVPFLSGGPELEPLLHLLTVPQDSFCPSTFLFPRNIPN